MSMAIFSPKLPAHFPLSPTQSHVKTHLSFKSNLSLKPFKKLQFQLLASADENGSGVAATVEDEIPVESVGSNGSPPEPEPKPEPEPEPEPEPVLFAEKITDSVSRFEDVKWVGGTWDLKQFAKNGNTDWDAVIDAEVKRRKWMQDNPQSSSNEEPIVFDTSIIPWWAWMKRFHLPEAELLNGRAAMIGFFMAYFVDSLTGVGLVDQMGNFFCKTLLFVAVAGVLLVRKNEDLDTIKKLLEETTFYDKQWQATWQDDKTKNNL